MGEARRRPADTRAGAWAELARVNDLELLTGTTMPHYAGRPMADGSHLVLQAVRTRDERLVEIGDRFPVKVPRRSEEYSEPELYLRARLAGLDARKPDRAAEEFALVDALVVRTDPLLVESHVGRADAPTASGIPVPDLAPPRGRRGATRLGAQGGRADAGPDDLGAARPAVVMSNLKGSLRGNEVGATVVVSLFTALCSALVLLLVRTISRPRASKGRERRG